MNEHNLKKFLSKVEYMEEAEAYEAGRIGYAAQTLIQATLPHSDPKQTYFERRNGDLTLSISANPNIGLPYGIYPRLILAWVVTEAVKTKSPELIFGSSFNQFMRKLDLVSTGGRHGTIAPVKKQMHRLFSSAISFDWTKKDSFSTGGVISIASKYMLWWDTKNPAQGSLLNSTVTLNTDFFNHIIEKPVPIDLGAIAILKSSCVALDLYCWLTYKMFSLKKETRLSWKGLQEQLGANYANTKQGRYNFKEKLKEQLPKVLTVYHEARVTVDENGLIMRPSATHVKKRLKST